MNAVVCQDEQLRERVHRMWTAVAGSWGELAEYVDARGVEVTARMLELADPRPGERVLELACGPGGVGIAAAELVGPAGEVVLSDVVPEMVSIATARARARGLSNVGGRVLDIEQIDEPDACYDVVVVREGLMFAVDPARAAREIRRILRPGGRVVIAVWGPRARNPWLGVVFATVSATLGKPVPPPGVPNPFSLDDADLLASLLREAALVDVSVGELETPLRTASVEEWWANTRGLAGPLTQIFTTLPEPALRALEERLYEAVRAYETPAGVEIPGVVLLARGSVGG